MLRVAASKMVQSVSTAAATRASVPAARATFSSDKLKERENALEGQYVAKVERERLEAAAAKRAREESSAIAEHEKYLTFEEFLRFRKEMMNKIRDLEDALAHRR